MNPNANRALHQSSMTASKRPIAATLRSTALAALLACAFAASFGCARPKPYVPTLQIPRRAAVLSFAESDAIRVLPNKEVKGWWFGGHDRIRNENVGEVVADELNDALGALSYLELYPRLELKYYMSARRDALKSAFKRQPATQREIAEARKKRAEMEKLRAERGVEKGSGEDAPQEVYGAKYTEFDYDKMMDRIDPVLVGRDLDVDYVVHGLVQEAYFARNRTIHWPWSRVEVYVYVTDVRTGKQIYAKLIEKQKSLITPERMLNDAFIDLAPEIDEALARAAKSVGVAMERARKPEPASAAAADKPATRKPAAKKPAAKAPARKPASPKSSGSGSGRR